MFSGTVGKQHQAVMGESVICKISTVLFAVRRFMNLFRRSG